VTLKPSPLGRKKYEGSFYNSSLSCVGSWIRNENVGVQIQDKPLGAATLV
jgi:hypothetical protein